MPKPLAEQVIVITGASSGIGRCAARYLASRGARVVVTARRADALDSLVGEIERAGGQALAAPGDVTSQSDLRAVARAAVERFGRIDTWVNNASVYIQGRVQDITLDEYRRVIDVDLMGVINGTKCALEQMLRQGWGGIIQVSSIVAWRATPWGSPYSAAKAGIDGFTQALRAELWGTDIHVSTLYVPPVDTPIWEHARGKFGTIPKPAPPVADPATVARIIGELAERPRNERTFGALGHFYSGLTRLPSRIADGILYHTRAFLLSDIPSAGDNLDQPSSDVPRERAGWAKRGWRGLTLRETTRVLPWSSLLTAVALGFLAARLPRARSAQSPTVLREP